ncbi:FCD domain-containing protein [Cupriavidus basilensis]
MFRLRIRLEPFAARLAAERADAEIIEQLKQCNDEMARAIENASGSDDGIKNTSREQSLPPSHPPDAAGSQSQNHPGNDD